MDLLELATTETDALVREARMDGADHVDPFALASGLKTITVTLVEPGALGGEKARFFGGLNGAPSVIKLSLTLPLIEQWPLLAHEVGHEIAFRLRERMPLGNSEEQFAWISGGILLIPTHALQRVWRRHERITELWGEYPTVNTTFASLRLGDSRLAEVWVVSEAGIVHARTDSEVGRTVRNHIMDVARCAIKHGKCERHGFEAFRQPDHPDRAVVLVAQRGWGW